MAHEGIGGWIEEHPWETGGAVFILGAFVILIVARGGSGGSTVQSGTDPGALALAQQAQQLQGTLALQNEQAATAIQIATLQEAGNEAALAEKLAESKDTNATNLALGLHTIQGTVDVATLQADAAQHSADTAAAVQLGISHDSATLNQHLADEAAATATHIADLQASTTSTIAGLSAYTQIQEATITGATQTHLADVTGETQRAIAHEQETAVVAQTQIAADVAKAQSSNSLFGGIVGAVGSVIGALL